MNTENASASGIPGNAVSVYGQETAMDDFPVLKAFQQYIDAEQNKARKRMVSLCVFFGILITAVIAVFMVILLEVSRRNQALNDRMVEYAMRERDRQASEALAVRQQTAAQDATASAAAMKALADTLAAMQKKLEAQTQAAAVKPAPPPQASAAELELERKTREADEKLRRARALLDAERKKLAEEKEKLRQEEIERHRRRLYPEYYGEAPSAPRKASTVNAPPSQPARRQLTDEDIADILKEADAAAETGRPAPSAAPSQPAEPVRPAAAPAKTEPDDDPDTPIEYFKDDEYRIPVDVKGKKSTWRVPLD